MVSGLVAGDWIWAGVRESLVRAGYPCLTMRDPLAVRYDSIAAATASLGRALDRFAIDRASIFGASLGSAVALSYAADNPARVQSLVISGAPAMGGRGLGIACFGKLTRSIAFGVAGSLFHDRSRIEDARVEQTFKLFLERRHLANMIKLLREARSLDAAAMLKRLAVSTLLVWGDDDKVSDCADWTRLSSLVSDATFVPIARCGHLPMIERPEQFMTALFTHLGRTQSALSA